MSVRSHLADARDTLRTQLWPVPTVGILAALLIGVLLPELDRSIDAVLPDAVTAYLFGGGASAARTVLDAIASSLITVTSLTFSLTVVTLQLASSQFSPRLLRTFTRDRFVHVTLGMFLATFVYALTVLRTVRTPDEQQNQFVPQISVTVAFVLALASVGALVLFLAHLAREIRVETMLRSVHRDASDTVVRILAEGHSPADPPSPADTVPVPPADATLIIADRSGFLTGVDDASLCAAAAAADAVVLIGRPAGGFVVAGTPLGMVWYGPNSSDKDSSGKFVDAIQTRLTIGFERNDTQDFAFGLRQLTDVTSKALSPGVNDPTTAVHSLGHTAALLCEIARHDIRDLVRRDDDGKVRVVWRRPTFAQVLEEALTQPRRYGAADPAVMARLLTLLRELAWTARTAEQRSAVTAQLVRLHATIRSQDFGPAEMGQLERQHEQVRDALSHRWSFDD